MKKIVFWLSVFAKPFLLLGFGENGVEEWTRFTSTYFETKQWELSNFVELRTSDQQDLYYYRASLRFLRKLSDNFAAGANLTFIRAKDPQGVFQKNKRLELEVFPKIKLTKDITLEFRERIEIQKISNQKKLVNRFRSIVRLKKQIKGIKWLKSISAHDEVFYNFNTQRVEENRFAFLELSIPVNEWMTFEPFLMLRSIRRDKFWQQNLVLGTYFQF